MLSTIEEVPYNEYSKLGLTREKAQRMLGKMLEIRRFEEKVEELFLVKGLLVGPSHLYLGQEAIAVGVLSALNTVDLMVTTYRCHGHALAKGVPANFVMAELFGKATGTCRGIGGSMHSAIYPEVGSLYATAIVGSGIPISAGMGLALKHFKDKRIVVSFFGDGAANTGAFHEGLNLASLWKLPVLFICENNLYAMSTRVDRSVAGVEIYARGAMYGLESQVVSGNDAASVYSAARNAAEKVRAGDGPFFLECRTYKQKGHGVYDKGDYRPKDEVEGWLSKDPIERFVTNLKSAQLLTDEELQQIESQAKATVEDSVDFASNSPVLEMDALSKYVYA